MGKEEDEVKRLRQAYQSSKSKDKGFSLSIPRELRTPIIWVLFFAVVGIIQKSIIEGKFVFLDFFSKYYIAWFASFGNFSNNYVVSSVMDIVYIIIKDWYYFFLTGGLISLIWAIIYYIVHLKFESKRDDFNLYVDNKLTRT